MVAFDGRLKVAEVFRSDKSSTIRFYIKVKEHFKLNVSTWTSLREDIAQTSKKEGGIPQMKQPTEVFRLKWRILELFDLLSYFLHFRAPPKITAFFRVLLLIWTDLLWYVKPIPSKAMKENKNQRNVRKKLALISGF